MFLSYLVAILSGRDQRNGLFGWTPGRLRYRHKRGASDLYGENEKAAITATVGSHNGLPVMLEIVCDTGEHAGPEDIEKFADGLYELVLSTLYNECIEYCNGVTLSYPHYQ